MHEQPCETGPRDRGLAILETEVGVMTSSLKRSNVWSRNDSSSSAHPTLLQPFIKLKLALADKQDIRTLDELDPVLFLTPFLDVIRSEVVTGPVTGLALDAMQKFLSYELLHVETKGAANAVENIADAVTHARFVGVDPSADEVVLMKILSVLRTLMLMPIGLLLTNESVCEIMQSTFRICFETRLSDLLRKTAELALTDMIQLLFTRLPTFSEENLPLLKKLKMRNSGSHNEGKPGRRSKHTTVKSGFEGKKKGQGKKNQFSNQPVNKKENLTLATAEPLTPVNSDCDSTSVASPSSVDLPQFDVDADVLARSPVGSVTDLSTCVQSDVEETADKVNVENNSDAKSLEGESSDQQQQPVDVPANGHSEVDIVVTSPKGTESTVTADDAQQADDANKDVELEKSEAEEKAESSEFVNSQGVTFKPTAETVDDAGSLIPYGLPCLRELFRFLVSLINPHEMSGSSNESMIQIALSLLATALETGAEHLDKYESLLEIVKDDLARNLVSLLSSERRLTTFSSALWISYLVFATQRKHLKYQMEIYLTRLIEIVSAESSVQSSYEHKEMVLELLVRLYKIPGFITELYLNYDCDLYTTNVFEDLTKMLSKNAFPLTGLYNTHLLSLEALLTVTDSIEKNCHLRIANNGKSQPAEPAENEQKSNAVSVPGSVTVLKGSGHLAGKMTLQGEYQHDEDEDDDKNFTRPAEMMSHEELMALKYKKKLITTATEQFNSKPAKGISYLQEVGLISTPLNVTEVAAFLRENPHLDKKQLGDYLSNRKNLTILEAFVQSFDFVGLRIDEALRIFLETFRLPGEAPLITLILEHFSDHWHRSSGAHTYIANNDSAFTLAYAVIMLNVDQHNKNATKSNDPMTLDQFRRNVRGTNDGGDHDQDMLAEVYHAIRNEEIVMPAEHTGLVKENYLWKCALKRGQETSSTGGRPTMIMASSQADMFDHDLFTLVWGPTLAALCYVFDKSRPSYDDSMIDKCLSGFGRFASVAAHYRMCDVIDNLVVSLSKFSGLQNVTEPPLTFVPHFGTNSKAKLATKCLFSLIHKHGDILRDGWKNVLEILLQLFRCELLPKSLMESEDYVDAAGRVRLLRNDSSSTPSVKVESGFLNSFVSFISMSSEPSSGVSNRPRTAEEEESAKLASKVIKECNVENLVLESKFLILESLKHLVDNLVSSSSIDFGPSVLEVSAKAGPGRSPRQGAASPVSPSVEGGSDGTLGYDEQATIFFLELLVRITVQNRDRVSDIWTSVSDHLARLIMASSSSTLSASTSNEQKSFLLERSVTALLRLSVRLGRKEDLATTVVQSLKTILGMKAASVFQVARQVAFGMYEMLRNNAANIHETSDWDVVFAIIEIVGAGASPDDLSFDRKKLSVEDDSGHGGSSETESQTTLSRPETPRERSNSMGSNSGGWIVLGNNPSAEEKSTTAPTATKEEGSQKGPPISFNQFSIVHPRSIVMHDSLAFLKSCESMAFLVRDVAHITPLNFGRSVQAMRTFVEASVVERTDKRETDASNSRDDKTATSRSAAKRTPMNKGQTPSSLRRIRSAPHHRKPTSPSSSNPNSDCDADESDNDDLSSEYHHVALQLLDLMMTLHTRAANIHKQWAEEGSEEEAKCTKNLWSVAWCPLLQGTARLCCDRRSHIRTSALTTLQRALLFHDLQTMLTAREWEASFTRVLFPMLSHLLIPSQPGEKTAMEETRTRAATLLGKVFLQHLTPLSGLPTFNALWLTVLEFMEKFMKAATSDLLSDAVPESLKNMLLVMDTAGIFKASDQLWQLTWQKLETFLPNLMADLFGDRQRGGGLEQTTKRGNDMVTVENKVENLKLEDCKEMQVESATEDMPVTPADPPIRHPTFFIGKEKLHQQQGTTVEEFLPPASNVNEMAIDMLSRNEESTTAGQSESVASTMPDNIPQEEVTSSIVQEEVSSFAAPPAAIDVKEEAMPIVLPHAAAGFKEEVTPTGLPQATAVIEKDVSSNLPPISSRIPFRSTQMIPPPPPAIVSLPSRPTIAPMPPPPPGILESKTFQNFQPIHAALPTQGTSGVPLAAPRPILGSYFGSSTSVTGSSNILTTSFTPTLINSSNPVVLTTQKPSENSS